MRFMPTSGTRTKRKGAGGFPPAPSNLSFVSRLFAGHEPVASASGGREGCNDRGDRATAHATFRSRRRGVGNSAGCVGCRVRGRGRGVGGCVRRRRGGSVSCTSGSVSCTSGGVSRASGRVSCCTGCVCCCTGGRTSGVGCCTSRGISRTGCRVGGASGGVGRRASGFVDGSRCASRCVFDGGGGFRRRVGRWRRSRSGRRRRSCSRSRRRIGRGRHRGDQSERGN